MPIFASPASAALQNGDLILAIDGQIVTSFRGLEKAVQKPEVTVTVWREGSAIDVQVATASIPKPSTSVLSVICSMCLVVWRNGHLRS